MRRWTDKAAASKPVTLKVGVLPIADLAPLYLGIDQGFFKEENLTIEPLAAGVSGAASEDKAWDALLGPKGGVTPTDPRDLGAPRGE